MPISVTGTSRRPTGNRERGFSLVELMVVLAIIGLLASAVVLAMPDPRGQLIDEGEAFAARANAAQEAAIVESRDMAMWVSPAGYGFERYRDGAWTPVTRPPFQDRSWGDGVTVSYRGSLDRRTRVVFDATGLNEPLNVTLQRDTEQIGVSIGADGAIRIDG